MATKGRPPKPVGTKHVKITTTLPPADYQRFEELRSKISKGLPVEIPRSDLLALALELLAELSPAQARKALAERRNGNGAAPEGDPAVLEQPPTADDELARLQELANGADKVAAFRARKAIVALGAVDASDKPPGGSE